MSKTYRGHTFEDYFKRASNPMVVLLLLESQPMYVYQMEQMIAKQTNGTYSMSLLYPVLYRLEKQGYVCSGKRSMSENNRIRQYYNITDSGKAHLEELRIAYQQMTDAIALLLNASPQEEKQTPPPKEAKEYPVP